MAVYPADGGASGSWGAELEAFEDITRDRATGKILLLAEKASAMTGAEGDRVVTDRGYVDTGAWIPAAAYNGESTMTMPNGYTIKRGLDTSYSGDKDGYSDVIITFPDSGFDTNCLQIFPIIEGSLRPASFNFGIKTLTKTAATIEVYAFVGTGQNATGIRWTAIGY